MILCIWKLCGGWVIEGRCVKCGRSIDLEHETYVKRESAKPHTGWQTYGGDWQRRKLRIKERSLLQLIKEGGHL